MNTVDERVQTELVEFEKILREVLAVAKDPEAVRWCLFSTGTKELEETVLKQVVAAMLPNVQGVFVLNVKDTTDVEALLRRAADEYSRRLACARLQEGDKFKLALGV